MILVKFLWIKRLAVAHHTGLTGLLMSASSKFALTLVFFLISACAMHSKSDKPAWEHEKALQIQGLGFSHKLWFRDGDGDSLYLVFHGDGMPWLGPNKIALDPTARHRQAFALWKSAPAPAYLVGRPCYFHSEDGGADSGASASEPNVLKCHPGYWTDARYSEEVVASLAVVIDKLRDRHPEKPLVLIGFSGGGVLATLVSQRLAGVNELITFAAPLDIKAWVTLHGYSPLTHSLNPADITLAPELKQTHYYGMHDNIVPQAVALKYLQRNDAKSILVNVLGHDCCWEEQLQKHLMH